ncbi:hypothetical protein C095_08170 [Fusobacterium necrophorum subsp. funduliforme B35]|uniref:Uncharacterized protein n=1 Tax=Fusobacterium necrophorum subsp. funduliforme B35 TaxID=1226633 RepID=A0A0B4E5C4_9FUSO|nr:hypothetical protein C095_08170 [Fusobacterium necrophorum subsp. funduliforme B35]
MISKEKKKRGERNSKKNCEAIAMPIIVKMKV